MGAPDLFLKHGRAAVADDISDEMARLCWLGKYLPVPAVMHFTRTPDQAWLSMTALPGLTARQVLEAQPQGRLAVVDTLALLPASVLTCAGAAPAETRGGTHASEYSIINLGPERSGGVLSERGEVALTSLSTDNPHSDATRLRFFDGRRVRDYGSFGDTAEWLTDINERGMVVGRISPRAPRSIQARSPGAQPKAFESCPARQPQSPTRLIT